MQEILARKALKELNRNDEVVIDHATPRTIIGGKEYRVIYPKYYLNYQAPKTVEMLFSGSISPERKEFLKNFPQAVVFNTNIGWDESKKYDIDEEYFNKLVKTKFVISPNGAGIRRGDIGMYGDPIYSWGYRFFDALFFRAIPIVEEDLNVYKGFKYYKVGDEYVYREDWVEFNLQKAKEEIML